MFHRCSFFLNLQNSHISTDPQGLELIQNVARYFTELLEVFVDLFEVLLVADFTPIFARYHKYHYSKRLPNAVAPSEIFTIRVRK